MLLKLGHKYSLIQKIMVKIIIGGDICPTKRDEKSFIVGNSRQLFSDLLNEIQSSELAIANLESPLINSQSPIKKSRSIFEIPLKFSTQSKRVELTF